MTRRVNISGHRLECLLFDFDGTLVDAGDAIYGSFVAAFERCGLDPPERPSVLRLIGYPLTDAFAAIAPRTSVPDLVHHYRQEFGLRSKTETRLLPSVRELIPRLALFIPLGIVSSRSSRGVSLMLEQFGLADKFSVIIAAEDVTCPKPSPEPVRLALTRLGMASAKAALLGDTPLDMQAARSSGVLPVGIATGSYNIEELRMEGAELVFADLTELDSTLKFQGG